MKHHSLCLNFLVTVTFQSCLSDCDLIWDSPNIIISPFFFFFFFAMLCGLWDLSYLTRDWTCVPHDRSPESQPLDHQGIPQFFFLLIFKTCKEYVKNSSANTEILITQPKEKFMACLEEGVISVCSLKWWVIWIWSSRFPCLEGDLYFCCHFHRH